MVKNKAPTLSPQKTNIKRLR